MPGTVQLTPSGRLIILCRIVKHQRYPIVLQLDKVLWIPISKNNWRD